MIQPEHIRRKAENLYPKFLQAWLAGEEFFPHVIRGRKRPDEDLAAAGESVRRLRSGSKEIQGYGYTVEWTERNSRTHGRNHFPKQILFETAADLLRFIGRHREFAMFAEAVGRIRSRHPELEEWIRANPRRLSGLVGEVDGMLDIVDYLGRNSRPMIFAREIPVSVDTKFIENHRGILREWLDRTSPPDTIRADENHFERRYGLRYVEPYVLVRFLDPTVQRRCGSPWPECAVPLHALAATALTVDRVLIVENKVNLLTIPPIPGSVAMGGLGAGVTDLRLLPWLSQCPLWYWGDLDGEGFAILSRLRTLLPQTQSLLMDHATFLRWKGQLAGPGSGAPVSAPLNLTATEQAAFNECVSENLRIEQERLPHRFVLETLEATFDLRLRLI